MAHALCWTGLQAAFASAPVWAPRMYGVFHQCYFERKESLTEAIEKFDLDLKSALHDLKDAEASGVHRDFLAPAQVAVRRFEALIDQAKQTNCVERIRIIDGTAMRELIMMREEMRSEIHALDARPRPCPVAESDGGDEEGRLHGATTTSAGFCSHRNHALQDAKASGIQTMVDESQETNFVDRSKNINGTAIEEMNRCNDEVDAQLCAPRERRCDDGGWTAAASIGAGSSVCSPSRSVAAKLLFLVFLLRQRQSKRPKNLKWSFRHR